MRTIASLRRGAISRDYLQAVVPLTSTLVSHDVPGFLGGLGLVVGDDLLSYPKVCERASLVCALLHGSTTVGRMSAKRAAADLEKYDGPIDVVELPGPVSRSTGGAVVESGTYDTRGVPRLYDESGDTQDEPSTAANESLIQYAKLSNPGSLPRVARPPRPNEPLDPRAVRLISFIDGRTPLGVIFTSAGMDEGEAIVLLAQLVDLGIIAVR
jgi:hypothetical protein